MAAGVGGTGSAHNEIFKIEENKVVSSSGRIVLQINLKNNSLTESQQKLLQDTCDLFNSFPKSPGRSPKPISSKADNSALLAGSAGKKENTPPSPKTSAVAKKGERVAEPVLNTGSWKSAKPTARSETPPINLTDDEMDDADTVELPSEDLSSELAPEKVNTGTWRRASPPQDTPPSAQTWAPKSTRSRPAIPNFNAPPPPKADSFTKTEAPVVKESSQESGVQETAKKSSPRLRDLLSSVVESGFNLVELGVSVKSLCGKIHKATGAEREILLGNLLDKLAEKGISASAGGDEKVKAKNYAYVAAVAQALGPEATNELVTLALRNEVSSLIKDGKNLNVDDRFRSTSMTVVLYTGVALAAMPELAADSDLMKKCVTSALDLQKSYKTDGEAQQQARFDHNKPIFDSTFGLIKDQLTAMPKSLRSLNSAIAPELERLFSTAKENPAQAQKAKYAKWDVAEVVTNQLLGFLFLNTINPAISATARNEGHQDAGTLFTGSLQIAVNEDANNQLKLSAEKDHLSAVHTELKKLIDR
ncbi:MAG: hypothetical protein LLF94_06065 [Chlamydiales bacterium]|nr:hypothetical protein [Chlamydiales bacterium]